MRLGGNNRMKIQKLSVEKLWDKYTFSIDFNKQISILIGKNGSGKSTILNLLDDLLSGHKNTKKYKLKKVSLEFDKNKSKEQENKQNSQNINYLFISTFDMEMRNKELLQKHYQNSEVKTELDIFLSSLIMQFKLYQLKLKEQVEKIQIAFDTKVEEYARDENLNLLKDKLLAKKAKIDFIYKDRDLFKNTLNKLFSDTGKTIKLDENNSIIFKINKKESLTPYQLSSGEKQILIILLNIVLLENKPTIVLMDEPEISLHVEWQMVLIQTLLEINPNLQLIITTHSPSIVSKGYRNNIINLNHFNTKNS
jgi:predicted ATP-binding protein involved in virulence